MSRREFGSRVREEAWKRCGGRCEQCKSKLHVGKFHYDHIMPDGLGGKPTLDNCQVLCVGCHHTKTTEEDRPIMEKADRIRKKHLGIWRPKAPMRKPPPDYNSWSRGRYVRTET